MSNLSTLSGFPPGTLMPWWSVSSTIPSGWALCNGQTAINESGSSITTPNLIGMYLVGTNPVGGSSTANPSGYGAASTLSIAGSSSHTHPYSVSGAGSTGGNSANTAVKTGAYGLATAVGHFHNFSATISSNTVAASILPPSCAMPWIMKL